MNSKRVILLLGIIAIIAAYFLVGGEKLLDPRIYKAQFDKAPTQTAIIFFLVFLSGTALSLPVCGALSVISGFLFGYAIGLPLALFACSIGGTIAYLMCRYLLQDFVQQRFANQLATVNKGMQAEGAFYIFSLRMIPVLPFWLLNLLAGMTSIRTLQFFFATLLGMLPITFILVNFGTQIGNIESFSMAQILTPRLILSFLLLACMPFLARGIVKLTRKKLNRDQQID